MEVRSESLQYVQFGIDVIPPALASGLDRRFLPAIGIDEGGQSQHWYEATEEQHQRDQRENPR